MDNDYNLTPTLLFWRKLESCTPQARTILNGLQICWMFEKWNMNWHSSCTHHHHHRPSFIHKRTGQQLRAFTVHKNCFPLRSFLGTCSWTKWKVYLITVQTHVLTFLLWFSFTSQDLLLYHMTILCHATRWKSSTSVIIWHIRSASSHYSAVDTKWIMR